MRCLNFLYVTCVNTFNICGYLVLPRQKALFMIAPNMLPASSVLAEDTEPFLCRECDHSGDADRHRRHPGGLLLQGGQLLRTSAQNGTLY